MKIIRESKFTISMDETEAEFIRLELSRVFLSVPTSVDVAYLADLDATLDFHGVGYPEDDN